MLILLAPRKISMQNLPVPFLFCNEITLFQGLCAASSEVFPIPPEGGRMSVQGEVSCSTEQTFQRGSLLSHCKKIKAPAWKASERFCCAAQSSMRQTTRRAKSSNLPIFRRVVCLMEDCAQTSGESFSFLFLNVDIENIYIQKRKVMQAPFSFLQ
jgi:hypothetical protein